MAAPAIPTELADLGAEWLGAVLGAAVESVRVLDSHSGTTGRARLGVTWAPSAGAGRPASVFVKFAPFDAEQRGFVAANQMGVREARLYRDLAAELPVRVPRPWHADFDADGRYVMVLEDLVAAGCAFPSPRDRASGSGRSRSSSSSRSCTRASTRARASRATSRGSPSAAPARGTSARAS